MYPTGSKATADIERRVAILLRKAMMLPVNEDALEDLPAQYVLSLGARRTDRVRPLDCP